MYCNSICVVVGALVAIMSLGAVAREEASHDSDPVNGTSGLSILRSRLDVTDNMLILDYKSVNNTTHDVWICERANIHTSGSEVYMTPGDGTLFVRRLVNAPQEGGGAPIVGRYVRLPAGATRAEQMRLPVPVHARPVLVATHPSRQLEHAIRLVIDIEYSDEDLRPLTLRNTYWCLVNESLNRNDRVQIPRGAVDDAKVLRFEVDDLRVPYLEEPDLFGLFGYDNFLAGTRLDVAFHPSALEFFYPGANEKALLSREESAYLGSVQNVIIKDAKVLGALGQDIQKGEAVGAFIVKSPLAHITCYRHGEPITHVTMSDDTAFVVELGRVFEYRAGISSLSSLRMLLPQIEPFDARLRCARNLENLWWRLQLGSQPEQKSGENSSEKERLCSEPSQWCECIVRSLNERKTELLLKAFKCPSAGSGRCHYAMNPNCKPDSPGNMVLLFETMAGWNQHGGPELFTFDNHDPKGGCVLLNDGTVKFIRTQEELNTLRWK